MINRRNIRVKVMQTLYTIAALQGEAKPGDAVKILQKHFDQTRQLFIYLTFFLSEVARFAETDAHTRASKHLPTYEDLHVNIKLTGNEVLLKIKDDPSFKEFASKDKPESLLDKELVKKIYHELVETKEYKAYTSNKRDKKEEREILEFILDKLLLGKEIFLSHIEENFSNWEDDGEMVIQLLVNYLQKPGSYNFKEMILMKMGVAEFLYFETIPPKVTINEYIDLAKEYSTSQSGQFVNGILDNIHKEMVLQGKMNKVDFRKA